MKLTCVERFDVKNFISAGKLRSFDNSARTKPWVTTSDSFSPTAAKRNNPTWKSRNHVSHLSMSARRRWQPAVRQQQPKHPRLKLTTLARRRNASARVLRIKEALAILEQDSIDWNKTQTMMSSLLIGDYLPILWFIVESVNLLWTLRYSRKQRKEEFTT